MPVSRFLSGALPPPELPKKGNCPFPNHLSGSGSTDVIFQRAIITWFLYKMVSSYAIHACGPKQVLSENISDSTPEP